MNTRRYAKMPVATWLIRSFPVRIRRFPQNRLGVRMPESPTSCMSAPAEGSGNALRALSRLYIAVMWLSLELVHGAAVQLPPVWRWSNPSPHGATIVDLATVGPFTVQVGERGQLFTSEDWRVWTPRDTHTTAALRGAAFFGGRLVVTGEAGTVLVADDPYQFYVVQLSTTNWLESVAASANRVVAVGDNASIYTSTNAVAWEKVTSPSNKWLRSVACNGSVFVAVGEGGSILLSESGLSWQTRSSSTSVDLNRVTWMGDHFLVLGDRGKALTSANGSSWTTLNLPATNHFYAAAGVTGTGLAAGDGEVLVSQDNAAWQSQLAVPQAVPDWNYFAALWNEGYYLLSGQSGLTVEGARTNSATPFEWSTQDDGIRSWLWSVARVSGHYVAVGDHGTLVSSPNGVDWEVELVPEAITNEVLLGVSSGSNVLVAAGTRGTVLWATNVYFWHSLPEPPTTNDLLSLYFDGNRFWASGGNGTLLASANGTDWSQLTTPTSRVLSSVASYPGGMVAVGDGGTILLSTNAGEVWELGDSGTTNWLSQVRWLRDRLVAVGENGTILTSIDGGSWQSQRSYTTAWLNGADFLEDTFVIIGNQGTFLASPDSTNWFSFPAASKKSLYGLAIHEGQLVTVGSEGTILRSQLLPDPTPISIAGYSLSAGMHLFLFTGGMDQQFTLQSSLDLVNWADGPLLEFLDGTGTLLFALEAKETANDASFFRAKRTR